MNAPTTSEPLVAPDLDDLFAVTDDVWRSLLGDAEELTFPTGTAAPGDQPWSGVVTVTGAWHGLVTVELGADVARALTRRMLALDEVDELADGDVADAVGELVNMIGGNVKSLMPGPSALSLPAVAAGRAVFASEMIEVVRLDAHWHADPVRVCVHAAATPSTNGESR